MYPQPVEPGTVKNNDSFNKEWKGPNSFGRIYENQKVTLEPGHYKAKVNHGVFFDEYHLPQITNIEFEVTSN